MHIPSPIQRWLRLCAAGLVLLGAAACAVLPKDAGRLPSQAIADAHTTALGQTAANSLLGGELSGFRLLPIASSAYLTRTELARLAQRSLDVQYYVLQNDDSGQYLLRSLRDAAQRGVRVRLLLDDLYTAGSDELLRGLASYPNVEVRLFNPFPAGRSSVLMKFVASAADFSRVNHRMHNKLFIADNAFAVAGGRNVGDEYFMRGQRRNFVDIDVLAAGPIVQQLSGIFDRYWNSDFVYPVAAILGRPPGSPAQAQQNFEQLTAAAVPPATETIPAEWDLFSKVHTELAAPKMALFQARGGAFADTPEKVIGANEHTREGTVRDSLEQAFMNARFEIVGITPYFIPGKEGGGIMTILNQRGVRVRIYTNSLASTDEPLAHLGYLRYRAALLQAGMEIYELSPSLAQSRNRMGSFGQSQGQLHVKAGIIDRRQVYLGSMNMDKRSERKNTELGLTIDSRELADQLMKLFDQPSSYRLQLAANRRDVEWVKTEDGKEIVLTEEPEVNWLQKLQLWLMDPLVSEDLL